MNLIAVTPATNAEIAKAVRIAKDVARFLRAEYGATRVLLFGSLVEGSYTNVSDIDLYFEGVSDSFTAIGHCLELFREVQLDLKPASFCEARFRACVLLRGVVL